MNYALKRRLLNTFFLSFVCISHAFYGFAQKPVAADNTDWLLGGWRGKAYFPGSDVSQYYNLTLLVRTMKANRFEGVLSTMEKYDTTVRYDTYVNGTVFTDYIELDLKKVFYVRESKGSRWMLSCNNCHTLKLYFEIKSNAIFFRGEVKDCYKECIGIKEFSRSLEDFDDNTKQLLYAMLNVAPPAPDKTTVAAVNPDLPPVEEKKWLFLQPEDKAVSIKKEMPAIHNIPPVAVRGRKPLVINADKPLVRADIVLQPGDTMLVKIPVNNFAVVQSPPKNLQQKSNTLIETKAVTNLEIRDGKQAEDTISKTELVKAAPVKKDTAAVLPEGYAERKKNLVKTLVVDTDSVTLRVYDNGVVDGDIVSVVYDDTTIINKLSLVSRAYVVKIAIPKGKTNTLVFHAHNLGEFPPNTARLEIIYGRKEEDLTISSDFTISSEINIEYKTP